MATTLAPPGGLERRRIPTCHHAIVDPGEHKAGCPLDPVRWLRHAIAACTQAMATGEEQANADRLAAASLLNALEHFADRDDWSTTTLRDVANYSSLMGNKFDSWCTCRPPGPAQSREW